jgi:hypothetical protein
MCSPEAVVDLMGVNGTGNGQGHPKGGPTSNHQNNQHHQKPQKHTQNHQNRQKPSASDGREGEGGGAYQTPPRPTKHHQNHQQAQTNGKTTKTTKNHQNLMEILGTGKGLPRGYDRIERKNGKECGGNLMGNHKKIGGRTNENNKSGA